VVARGDAIDEQRRYCVEAVCNGDFRSQVERAEQAEARNGTLAWVAFSVSALSFGAATAVWLGARGETARGPWAIQATADARGFALGIGGHY
jgi:hypothetical protein